MRELNLTSKANKKYFYLQACKPFIGLIPRLEFLFTQPHPTQTPGKKLLTKFEPDRFINKASALSRLESCCLN